METAVSTYVDRPSVVVLDLVYITGLTDASDPSTMENGILSTFPSFYVEDGEAQKGWMAWAGNSESKGGDGEGAVHLLRGGWGESLETQDLSRGGEGAVYFSLLHGGWSKVWMAWRGQGQGAVCLPFFYVEDGEILKGWMAYAGQGEGEGG